MKPKQPTAASVEAAVTETLRLSCAWIAYLLHRLGEPTLRIPAADITAALDTLSCSVEKDGEDYIITLSGKEETP